MFGDVDELMWAIAAAAVVALLITLGSRGVARRRRREHEALMRGAAARMCAQLDGEPTTLRQLRREIVDILERQDEGDRACGSGAAEADRLLASPEEEAVLAGAVAMIPAPLGPGGRSDDDWPVDGRVPRVADHPDVPRLCAWMRSTTLQQIGLARAVLVHAARLGEPGEECRRRLLTAFDRADDQVRAASGDTVAVLRELARLDLPIPEDGVPGQANAHDLRQQVRALALLALRHRRAAALWRAAAAPVTTRDEGQR